ncbi:MAG: DUF3073 domain-containing protein [Propionibacterium sp.]|nr:DUF3073 domain-containing protein [Propionibacterium sp.]
MGRGRAKAKQTKVARDLKYRPVDTDFASLERELRGERYSSQPEQADPYIDAGSPYDDADDDPDKDDDDDRRS